MGTFSTRDILILLWLSMLALYLAAAIMAVSRTRPYRRPGHQIAFAIDAGFPTGQVETSPVAMVPAPPIQDPPFSQPGGK